jgi:uncharacterized protein
MSLDVTPSIPSGRQIIQAYGDGGFRIAGTRHEGSVLVFRERTLPWACAGPEAMTPEAFQSVVDAPEPAEILLVGCGAAFAAVPKGLREGLKARGLVLEWMDTPAACRTFNVLLAEDRRFAAALVAVG